jgi:hypothetical protein
MVARAAKADGENEPEPAGDAGRGLYDGFEGYQTPTTADYQGVFRSGMVIPDANVLLNLYRYTDQARDDLLLILERLGDQLWVPHQVLVEFWRNRDSVLRDPRDTDKAAQELSGARDRTMVTFRTWANRVSLAPEESKRLLDALSGGFEAVIDGVDRFSDASAIESARDTDKDAVLKRLESILAGRVGSPLGDEDYKVAVTEGLRRVDAREPPGYLDKPKDDDGAAGDYLVWEQVLVEAERRRCNVVFVTGDVKEDWWRREAGEQRGPRLELVNEMRTRCETRLFMLRPPGLLSLAGEVLSVAVHKESVENTDRVDRIVAEEEGALPNGGWSANALEVLLSRLEEEAPVQAAVLTYATEHGGIVDRDKVYELGSYEETRSLRGFTRPITRIAQMLRDADEIDGDAVDLFEATYDSWAVNPSMAVGFAVNRQALPLLIAAMVRRRDD